MAIYPGKIHGANYVLGVYVARGEFGEITGTRLRGFTVLSLEGNNWFVPSKVATLADTYVNSHGQTDATAQLRAAECRPTTRVSALSVNAGNRPGSPEVSPIQG